MAQFRVGQYELALEPLETSVTFYRPRPEYLFFLAMCHYRLGHVKEAQQRLAEGKSWIDQAHLRKRDTQLSLNNRVTWSEFGWTKKLQAEWLYREAESLINESSGR
jgi:hypothetical protein